MEVIQQIIDLLVSPASLAIAIVALFISLNLYHKSSEALRKVSITAAKIETHVTTVTGRTLDMIEGQLPETDRQKITDEIKAKVIQDISAKYPALEKGMIEQVALSSATVSVEEILRLVREQNVSPDGFKMHYTGGRSYQISREKTPPDD